MLHGEITRDIIRGFFDVYNTLGYGFLERVYENALALELKELMLQVDRQVKIDVYYYDDRVGTYFADMVVERKVLLELKTADTINNEHISQLINYLRSTEYEVGLLLNFGRQPQFARRIFTNNRKGVISDISPNLREDPLDP
ncbi:GxxExxY protein [bacterium]|nr:GxxExxY protein [bacterium]